MSLGTSIAYISSVAQLISAGITSPSMVDNGTFYFDSVVFLTLFLLLGRLIEQYSKSKTGDAVMMLGKLRPTEALLVDADNSVMSVKVDLLEFGDIVRILHGGSPPCDGTVSTSDSKVTKHSYDEFNQIKYLCQWAVKLTNISKLTFLPRSIKARQDSTSLV